MLTSQTRTEIVTRSETLGLTPGMLRLKSDEVTGRIVPNIDCLDEAEGQALGDALELILWNRRANQRARLADLRGASVGGSRIAELEAMP
jgi:hypothetical protein